MMPAFHARLLDELQNLRPRLTSLGQFIASEDFQLLGPRQQYLLQRQQEVMTEYYMILEWRLQDLASRPPAGRAV